MLKIHVDCPPPIAATGRSFSRRSLVKPLYLRPRKTAAAGCPHGTASSHLDLLSGTMPVSPFVVANVPGTTRMHASGLRLPCRRHRPKQTRLPPRPLSAFYSGHTPSLRRFNHLTDQGQAPGTTPAAAAIPALVMHFDSQVTWLSGVTPRAHLALWPGFRHGIVSEVRRTSISGGRTQKLLPYP